MVNCSEASVIFTAPGIRGEAGIDLQAGTNLEEAQVAAPSGVQRVQNLDQLVVYGRGGATQTFAPDWLDVNNARFSANGSGLCSGCGGSRREKPGITSY